MKIRNLSIKFLIVMFVIFTFLLIIMGVVSVRYINTLASQIEKIYRHPFMVSNAVLEVNINIISMHSYMKDVALARNTEDLEVAISKVRADEKAAYQRFEIIMDRFLGDKSRILDVRKTFSDWKPIRSQVIELTRASRYDEAVEITKNNGAVHVALLMDQVDGLVDFANVKAAEFLSNSQSIHSKSVVELRLFVVALLALTGIGTFFVICRVRTVESTLRESEERYRYAIEGTSDGLWDWNIKTDEDYFSPRWLEILEYQEGDLEPKGEFFFSLIHPEDQGFVDKALKNHLQNDAPYSVEFRMQCQNGEYKWIHSRGQCTRNHEGKPIRMTGVIEDVSARKKTESILREQEWRYRSVTDSSPDGIIAINSRSDIISWNKGAENIFGFTAREMLGNSLIIIIPKEFRETHITGLKRITETGQAKILGRTVELTALKKDGGEFPIELTLGSWKGNDGVYFGGFIRDITVRKEMEKVLRQSQRMDALGNLAGGIAHDVNNMLLPIISLTGMTIKDLPAGSRERKRLEKVVEAGIKAKNLIAKILSFSHRSDLEVKREEINLNDLVHETLDLLRSTLPSTITVTEKINPDIGMVLCDPSQISTILMNMGSNTSDALEGHVGEFSVSVTSILVQQGLALKVSNLKPGKYAKITVFDTGKGMDAQTLEHIFDPFFTTKKVGEGTGLGLAMSHGIITKHDGAIDVSSKLGVGTSFDIYIPLVDQGE